MHRSSGGGETPLTAGRHPIRELNRSPQSQALRTRGSSRRILESCLVLDIKLLIQSAIVYIPTTGTARNHTKPPLVLGLQLNWDFTYPYRENMPSTKSKAYLFAKFGFSISRAAGLPSVCPPVRWPVAPAHNSVIIRMTANGIRRFTFVSLVDRARHPGTLRFRWLRPACSPNPANSRPSQTRCSHPSPYNSSTTSTELRHSSTSNSVTSFAGTSIETLFQTYKVKIWYGWSSTWIV